MFRKFHPQAEFYIVYILEAHASDVWQMPVNERQNVVISSPRNLEERTSVADSCVRKLNIELPALIDDFRNTTETAYTGWPDRIYVIDREGHVAYKSKPGPFGFQPAEAAAVLERTVGVNMDAPR